MLNKIMQGILVIASLLMLVIDIQVSIYFMMLVLYLKIEGKK